jgi:putative tricarboxylic transport membrane protein
MKKTVSVFREKDQTIGGLIFVIALFLYYRSASFAIDFHDPLGPAFFPRVICIGLMCLSILMIFSGFCKKEKEATKTKQTIIYKRIAASLLIIILYILALEYNLSYMVSTAVFLFLYILIMQNDIKIRLKSLLKYALVSLLTTLVIYYLFEILLELMVP